MDDVITECKQDRKAYRRRYYLEHKAKALIQMREWARIHLVACCAISKRYRDRHPDRKRAQNLIRSLRRAAKLSLTVCSWSGCIETNNIEAHHPDYSKPYEIIALCKKHHQQWHRDLIKTKA